MIETIIQWAGHNYPFDQLEEDPSTKLDYLVTTSDEEHLSECKKKNQLLKNNPSPYTVSLLQIYQEGLILHLVYECVPFSLKSFLERWRSEDDSE